MTERAKDPTPEASAAADECATEDGAGGPHFVMPGHLRRHVALALDAFAREAVEKERQKIAGWLDCSEDCRSINWSGVCQRTSGICFHYLAERISAGERP